MSSPQGQEGVMGFTYAEIVDHALADGRPACVPCADQGVRMVGGLHPPGNFKRWMCYEHWIEHLKTSSQDEAKQLRLW